MGMRRVTWRTSVHGSACRSRYSRPGRAAVNALEDLRQDLVPAVVASHAVQREHHHARVVGRGAEDSSQGLVSRNVELVQAGLEARAGGVVHAVQLDLREIPQVV
jgi:hypothetical protein